MNLEVQLDVMNSLNNVHAEFVCYELDVKIAKEIKHVQGWTIQFKCRNCGFLLDL